MKEERVEFTLNLGIMTSEEDGDVFKRFLITAQICSQKWGFWRLLDNQSTYGAVLNWTSSRNRGLHHRGFIISLLFPLRPSVVPPNYL